MDIKELHSFTIADAVKFHDQLNPKLWRGQHLRPEVKDQLEIITKDFLEELGINGLDVKDITVSGSNAAYSYTRHSDLDLHILVDMSKYPDDDVYRELFDAKKTIYNDTHDIKIHGVPVELYVQDSSQPVVSLGEYSLMNDKWIRIPTKRRANFDQTATKRKYEKLLKLAKLALHSKKYKKVSDILKTIKRYRQAGLDKGGEFGPENLAYKALRSQGYITKLYDLKNKLHSEALTIETMYQNIDEAFDQPYPLKWETSDYGDVDALARLPDGSPLSIMFNQQQDNDGEAITQVEFYRNNSQEVTGEGDAQRIFATVLNAIQKYIKKYKPLRLTFSASKLLDPSTYYDPDELVPNPESRAKLYDRLVQRYARAWGYRAFRADNGDLVIYELSRIQKPKAVGEDYTGQFASEKTPPVSPYAGIKDNQYRGGISEEVSPKYVTRVDMTLRTDFMSGMKTYYGTDDWHESGLEKKDNFTQEMKGLYAGEPHRTALYASGNASKTRFLELNDPKTGQPVVYFDKKDIPRIRNTKTYVSVFDASRFKKLPTGEYFSENPGKPLKQEEITDPFKYMTNNGWVVRVTDDIQKEFKKAQQLHKAGKIDHYGGENLTEASGYIPSEKQKNDPRFKTALTVDVHPDSIKKNAKAFYWNTSRAGIPPTARTNGKIS